MSLGAGPAIAEPDRELRIEHAWARATLAGQTTSPAYLTITSAAGDRLIAVATPAASSAVLRQTLIKGGQIAHRAMAEGAFIGAHQTIAMHANGRDILLSGLHAPLVAGTTIALALTFQGRDVIDVAVPVLAADAPDPYP